MNTMRYSSYPYPHARKRFSSAHDLRGRASSWRQGSWPWGIFMAATALIALLLLPFVLLAGMYMFYTLLGHTFPGVTVGPLAAGDMSRAELARKIDMEWNQQPVLKLSDGQRSWAVAPAEIGLRVDSQATAERAFAVGRGPQGLTELLWLMRFRQKAVEPVITLDLAAAQSGLERLSAQVNQPARDATLRFENGQWSALPGQNGSSLLIEPTLQKLAAQPLAILTTGYLPLVMQTILPRVADLTPALEQLRGALDQPLKLQAYDPITDETIDWQVPRETFAGWVTVQEMDGQVSFTLDSTRLNAYLEQWKGSLGAEKTLEPFQPPADLSALWQSGQPLRVTIRHNATTYTVEAGDTLTRIAFKVGMPYWKIQQANPGLEANKLSAGQVLTIPSKNEMLPLPVVPNKRIVVNISQQRMWTYENGAERSEHVISTGIDRSPTITGVYQIRTHDPEAYASVWDLYMPSFMGIYEGWPGFMNGFHGLPKLSNGTRLWDGYLGRKVSYGCIILSLQEAEDLFNWAEEGVVVEIQP